jgi:hypothetical protein
MIENNEILLKGRREKVGFFDVKEKKIHIKDRYFSRFKKEAEAIFNTNFFVLEDNSVKL